MSHVADRRRQKRRKTAASKSSDPTAVDDDGMLLDVVVPPIQKAPPVTGTLDILHFATAPALRVGKSGDPKLHRQCKECE